MIRLETKVDYSVNDDGKVFARELNLIGSSLKNIILPTGDTRLGDDNTEAVLGAIDDIIRTQLFKIVGSELVRYSSLVVSTVDPLEVKTGQIMYILVEENSTILNTISIAGIAYTLDILGTLSNNIIVPGRTIMKGIVDSVAKTITVVDHGTDLLNGNITYDSTVLVDNASYTGIVNIDIDVNNHLVLVEQSTTAGTPKTININTTLKEGSMVMFENYGLNEVTDTIITTQAPIKDIGTSLHLNTVGFKVKIFVENGELKADIIETLSTNSTDSNDSLLVEYDTSNASIIDSNNKQYAIVKLSDVSDKISSDINDNNSNLSIVESGTTTQQTTVDGQDVELTAKINNLPGIKVDAINVNGQYSMSILSNGKLYTANNGGRLGVDPSYTSGSGLPSDVPIPGIVNMTEVQFPDEDFSITSIIQMGEHQQESMYALFDNGNLYMWGKNSTGSCGLGHLNPVPYPTLSRVNVKRLFSTPSNVNVEIANQHHVLEDNDGTIHVVGYNGSGQLGLGDTINRSSWTPVLTTITSPVRNAWSLGATYGSTIVQLEDGTVLVTGNNERGQLGNGTFISIFSFSDMTAAWGGGLSILKISGGFGYWVGTVDSLRNGSAIMMLFSDNSLKIAGANSYGEVTLPLGSSYNNPVDINLPASAAGQTIIDIASNGAYSKALLMSNGDLYTWGYNSRSFVGDGTATHRYVPYLVDTNVDKILGDQRASDEYAYISSFFWQKTNGEVWSTGWGIDGQRGDGTRENTLVPTRVALPRDDKIKFIGSLISEYYRLIYVAVTESNKIYIWGNTTRNGFDLETVEDILSPRRISFKNIKGQL